MTQFIPRIYNKIIIKILGYFWGVTVPALIPQDIRTLHGSDEENDGIPDLKNVPKSVGTHAVPTRVLELLHMDLMGHMQLENIARKRYIHIKIINTTCYILNRVYLQHGTLKSPYEIWKGKQPYLKHFMILVVPAIF